MGNITFFLFKIGKKSLNTTLNNLSVVLRIKTPKTYLKKWVVRK